MSLRCWIVRRRLVAWIDGEIPPAQALRVERHVVDCPDCRTLAAHLGDAIAQQRELLAREREPADFDCAGAWATLWRAAAEPSAAPEWVATWHPLLAAGLATVMVVLLAALVSGRPRVVLVPLGIEAPPHAVAQQPELYRNYPILERLDALEHFDTVQSVPLEDQPSNSG